MIGPLAVLSILISVGVAAPTTYDQRQDGDFNLHAKLDNFLIVVAIPSANEIGIEAFNNLANQALELKGIVARHHAPKEDPAAIEDDDEDHKTAGVFLEPKEPYKVEIIRIEKEEATPSTKNAVPEGDKQDDVTREVLIAHFPSVSSGDRRKDAKEEREDEKTEEHSQDEKKRARNLWNRLSGSASNRQGTSLKKELSSKSTEESQDLASGPSDRNEVGLTGNKPEELKLLGSGIENCGPDRQRNRSGICQFASSD